MAKKVLTGKDLSISINGQIMTMAKNIEYQMYFGRPQHEMGLRKLLGKLGIKSAIDYDMALGRKLEIEPLEVTLKQVTFDDSKLKLWKP